MKTFRFLAIGFCAALLTTLYSCDKEDSSVTDEELSSNSSNESHMSSINDEVINEADEYVTEDKVYSSSMAVKGMRVTASTGPDITVTRPETGKFPVTVSVDFGTEGFTGKRGNVLKGKMIVTVSDSLTKANSKRSINFQNFSVNGNSISGNNTISYNGKNAYGNRYWSISASDTITLASDGTVVIWNSERVREQLGSIGNNLRFSISGTSYGVNPKGKSYTMIITNPLIIYPTYPHFVQGTVKITSGRRFVTLDYGDGTKDSLATVTIGTTTRTISLTK